MYILFSKYSYIKVRGNGKKHYNKSMKNDNVTTTKEICHYL